VAESGLPGFDLSAWNGVMAPRGTPNANIMQINREMRRIIEIPEIRERAAAQGADLVVNSPQEFTTYVQAQIQKWAKLVRESGMKND
jgi:tripartite-type tricarboxylate transporter receptor subunit TctC